MVDGSRKGNIARFINHSCEPNLYVEKWWVNRVPRLGLFAKRPIAEGEEVSYNYSVKWFGDARAAQRCFLAPPLRARPGAASPIRRRAPSAASSARRGDAPSSILMSSARRAIAALSCTTLQARTTS